MANSEPTLVEGPAGWVAAGEWGGVFGVTRDEAIRLFHERARFHAELLKRPKREDGGAEPIGSWRPA